MRHYNPSYMISRLSVAWDFQVLLMKLLCLSILKLMLTGKIVKLIQHLKKNSDFRSLTSISLRFRKSSVNSGD